MTRPGGYRRPDGRIDAEKIHQEAIARLIEGVHAGRVVERQGRSIDLGKMASAPWHRRVMQWFQDLFAAMGMGERSGERAVRRVMRGDFGGRPMADGRRSDRLFQAEGDGRHVDAMMQNPAPWRTIETTPEAWRQEFGDSLTVQTPIGPVKIGEHQREKLIANGREQFAGLIKPTLEGPALVVKNERGATLYMRAFTGSDGRARGMMSVTINKDGVQVSISNSRHEFVTMKREAEAGAVLYRSLAGGPELSGPTPQRRGDQPLASDGSLPTSGEEGKHAERPLYAIPTKPREVLAGVDREAAARFDAAARLPTGGWWSKVVDGAKAVKELFTRTYRHLDEVKDAEAVDILRHFEADVRSSGGRAARQIMEFTRDLSPVEYQAMSRILASARWSLARPPW